MYLQNLTTSDEDLFYVSNASTTAESTVDPTVIFGAQRDSLKIVIPVTIIYCLIFVTGLVGNILTCIVITRNKSMHTATNYYLFSLAISDLLLLISGMPQEIYSIWYKWPYVFGETFCLFRGLAAETSTNASILTISLFTIERYLAICHPFQSHKMSKLSRATKHVLALWVAAFLFALPQALQFGLRSHKGVVMCLQTRVILAHSFEVSTFLFFCAPIVLISVLYFLIGLRLKETSKGRVSMDHEQCTAIRTVKLPKRHSQSTKRVIKMLVAVVVAFFVCWAPFHAQRLLAIYGTTENHLARSPNLLIIYGILTYTSGILYYVSTSINPILYHIMCNKFRVAFKNTLVRCCPRRGGAGQPGAAVAFARVPTSSGSNVSSNNTYRKETQFCKKTSLNADAKQNPEGSTKITKWNTQGSWEPLYGRDRFCPHKFSSSSLKWMENENIFNATQKQINDDKRQEISPAEYVSTKDSVKYSDSSPSSVDDDDLEDELAAYLRNVNRKIRQQELEFR